MRLIDADELKKKAKMIDWLCNKQVVSVENIDNAPTVDFEKLGESLRCQIRAEYGSCDGCELSCPRNELINLLNLERPQGEWKIIADVYCKCPFCSNVEVKFSNYCPECGARLEGGKE